MLQNAYLLAKIGADTAENEQHFAEILPTDALCCSFSERATSNVLLVQRLRDRGSGVAAHRGAVAEADIAIYFLGLTPPNYRNFIRNTI